MSERKTPRVIDKEELLKQKQITLRIRENNEMEKRRSGKQMYMHIITFGCQQNNSDSEKIKGMLAEMGYAHTEHKEQADLIIINTCCVRENAELKLYGNIGALKQLKTENPSLIIAVCGCMMQQEHAVAMIRKKYRHVDLIFGTHNVYKLPELLERSMDEKYTLIDILNTEGAIIEDIPILRDETFKAWVTIMYGCNNFCSYCIVPHVRGRERSRMPEDIIKEIEGLAKDGCKEVTLLGQNVNSYGKDLEMEVDFADLIKMVNEIDGIERIRFMTSHPKDISDKLIYTMRDNKRYASSCTFPFQAGSDEILRRMNRKYTKEEYLRKVNKAKEEIPGLALSTDVIVGFPGETDADFEETLDVLRRVESTKIFMFIYSRRIGTPAAEMEDPFSYEDKHRNFEKLVQLQNEISRKANEAYLGKDVEVLVEGLSKMTPQNIPEGQEPGKVVNFSGAEGITGKLVLVRINEIHSWFLNGEMVNEVN